MIEKRWNSWIKSLNPQRGEEHVVPFEGTDDQVGSVTCSVVRRTLLLEVYESKLYTCMSTSSHVLHTAVQLHLCSLMWQAHFPPFPFHRRQKIVWKVSPENLCELSAFQMTAKNSIHLVMSANCHIVECVTITLD